MKITVVLCPEFVLTLSRSELCLLHGTLHDVLKSDVTLTRSHKTELKNLCNLINACLQDHPDTTVANESDSSYKTVL